MFAIRKSPLRKLRDTDLASVNYMEDIRAGTVLDVNERKVGHVDALFVDQAERKVRFFRVAPDSIMTTGGKVLVPVDSITRIRSGNVHIDRTLDQLAAAPDERSLAEDARLVVSLYAHYRYQPFWRPGYVYPPYPFYM